MLLRQCECPTHRGNVSSIKSAFFLMFDRSKSKRCPGATSEKVQKDWRSVGDNCYGFYKWSKDSKCCEERLSVVSTSVHVVSFR